MDENRHSCWFWQEEINNLLADFICAYQKFPGLKSDSDLEEDFFSLVCLAQAARFRRIDLSDPVSQRMTGDDIFNFQINLEEKIAYASLSAVLIENDTCSSYSVGYLQENSICLYEPLLSLWGISLCQGGNIYLLKTMTNVWDVCLEFIHILLPADKQKTAQEQFLRLTKWYRQRPCQGSIPL